MFNILLIILLIIIAWLLAKLLKPLFAGPILYYIDSADAEFISETKQILIESSINKTHRIAQTDNPSAADITIRLAPRAELDKYHKAEEKYPDGRPIRFSLTWQKPKPHISIDDINWRYGVKESGLSLDQYRKYVIQHEFMHALGYDHQPCNEETAKNGTCPILYQSTRGCPSGYKCGYTITEADYGKKIPGSYF
jgi:hypothetical protein